MSKQVSIEISGIKNDLPRDEFYILSDNPMPKREEPGKYLEKARKREGLTLVEAKERAELFRAEIGATTIRDVEAGRTGNPGVKTLEAICLAAGEDPLKVTAMYFEHPPEQEPGFQESQWAQMWKRYSKAKPDKRKFVDQLLAMAMKQLED